MRQLDRPKSQGKCCGLTHPTILFEMRNSLSDRTIISLVQSELILHGEGEIAPLLADVGAIKYSNRHID